MSYINQVRKAVTGAALMMLLSSGLTGCRQSAAPATEGAQQLAASTVASPTATPALLTALAPADFNRALSGSIGGKYEIHMELRRAGDKLFGNYFYPRPGAIRYISLDGTVDAQGNATLTESTYDPNTQAENKTGEFKGQLDSVLDEGEQLVRLAGQWTRAKDKQTLPFSAQEPRFDLGGARLVRQTQKDENKQQGYSIETRWPQLTGDAARVAPFNQAVRKIVFPKADEFKKAARAEAADPELAKTRPNAPLYTRELDYTVNFANRDFVSLLFSFYEYTGGAHGNTGTAAFNYDLARGRLIKLGDLFKPGASYLRVISDYCISELQKLQVGTGEWIAGGAGPKLENYGSWNVTPQGLRITFDAYQVASYAEGPQEVIVPYSLLKDLINPDGPLASFIK